MIVEMVARPLSSVVQDLDKRGLKYKVIYTLPIKRNVELLSEDFYVIRQTTDEEGVYILVAAAKMAKEVTHSGI